MLKKLVSTCLLSAAVFSAGAVEGSMTYTYAGDECGYWGKSKAEIYDVAIRINDPALAGKKITGIRAVLNAYDGIESTSLWLTKELTLEKVDGVKVTVPDTYSAAVTPEQITLPGFDGNAGQLSVVLDNPYVLTEEGIYVGYSLTVPTPQQGVSLTAQQKYPVMLSPCVNSESLYLRTSKDFLKWVPYNDKLASAAMIYVTLEGEFAEYSIGINNLAMTYAPQNEDFSVKATLSNIGLATVSNIGYSYSIGDKTFRNTLNLDTPIEPDFINSTVVDLPIFALSELGEFTLDLKINTVNGHENGSIMPSASVPIKVLPFVPVHRPMLEEFTGTWCGWCTRGYYALETLNELYGDGVVLAAYHDSDPMQVTSKFPVNAGGFPSASLNRNGVEDPFYGKSNDGFGMKDEVLASMQSAVPAAIEVSATWSDVSKTSISVKAQSTFFETKAKAGYRIGYLLINNGLSGDDLGWTQSNYFAGYAAQYRGTELEVLTTWPSAVEGLVFNDVVVDVTGMMGVAGSVPSDIVYNTPYETEFSFNIADNDVIQDRDKLYVAAFIINPDGTVLNANKAKVVYDSNTSVDTIGEAASEVSAEYYNLAGVRVVTPQEGILVKVSKMSDGTIRTAKVVVK